MTDNELEKYKMVIGYGIGENYYRLKEIIREKKLIQYVADRRWEGSEKTEYDGYEIISVKEIEKTEGVLIVVISDREDVLNSLKTELIEKKVDIVSIYQLIHYRKYITSNELKREYQGVYEDDFHNKIYFDDSIPDNINIWLGGSNAEFKVGHDINVLGYFNLLIENNGYCEIGDRVSIGEVNAFVAEASLKIGKDCLFSYEITIRTHDGHHIFDAKTGKRINYAKSVEVGDKVWIGHRVTLLPGAKIGQGSVMGYGAVTSSCFLENQLLVGCPAKVIRENVIWSKDNTGWFMRDYIEECMDQSALLYIKEES